MVCAALCVLTLQSIPCKICPVLMKLFGEVEISSATQKDTCMHNPI